MKKEYLKPDMELVSFSADEEILSNDPTGEMGLEDIAPSWFE